MKVDNIIRYRGHLSLCEIDRPGQEKISEAKVLIIGCGGLGSPVALYLAAAGVGKITIMDADTVSLSNLQRQVLHTTADVGRPKVQSALEKLRAVNPNVEIDARQEFLTPENAHPLVKAHDLVIDCTDNLDTRLLINDVCVAEYRSYIFGAVRRWGGQLFTHVPGSATYDDFFDVTPAEDVPCAIDGVLNTVVGVIGTLQATEAIKVIVGTGDLLVDRLLVFDAITMTFNKFEL